MGAYLSEPVKEKVSEDGGDPRFSYGASSMQGWRISQEDAHNCILSLGDDAKLSLFAVYDGHGGAEVAQYTAQHFPQHIFKQKQSSSKTNFSDSLLEESFLSFDQHLKLPAVLQNLREIAGGGGKPANKDADPKEARMLQKEASMPLEQILAKYVHHRASAMLKERRRADGEEVSDDEEDEGEEDDEEEDDDEEDDEEGDEEDDDDDDDDDAQDEEENEDEEGEKVVNGEKEDNAEQEKTPKENGVMVNGDHATSEEAAAEAEAEEEKSSSSSKESKFEMEEFGIKGASKCGKGGKGKGKKTLLPRVPIEASPAIQAKTDSKAPKTESKLAKVDPAPIPLKMDLEQQLLNGHSENENNENKEREQQTRTNGDNNTPREEENDRAAVATAPTGTASSLKTEGDDGEQQQHKSEFAKESDSKEKTTTTTTVKEAATNGDVEKKSAVVKKGSSAEAEAAEAEGEKKVDAVVEEEGANAEGSSAGSSAAAATSAGSKRSRKAAPVRHVKLLEMNTDDDSDDSEDDLETKMMKDLQEPESDDSEGDDGEDDDVGGEDDEEDGEDDEDEEAEGDDDDDDEDYEDIQGGGEEPGFDSGCTACVSLLVGNELFVANVGDSRCVVSRAGEAVDMSFDHKPTDEVETDRITKAGGKVTEDGRVNGGLNLSRALGDHSYKKVTNLSDREQMISALPDIKSMVLTNQDEFMVIACDGIWNSLTSQEVIDFVKMRIDHEKELTLSQICEELFDHCLAPHTMGDGTGCDNMTCIIVRFDSLPAMSGSGKRSKADDGEEAAEAPSGKRQRLDGDDKDAA